MPNHALVYTPLLRRTGRWPPAICSSFSLCGPSCLKLLRLLWIHGPGHRKPKSGIRPFDCMFFSLSLFSVSLFALCTLSHPLSSLNPAQPHSTSYTSSQYVSALRSTAGLHCPSPQMATAYPPERRATHELNPTTLKNNLVLCTSTDNKGGHPRPVQRWQSVHPLPRLVPHPLRPPTFPHSTSYLFSQVVLFCLCPWLLSVSPFTQQFDLERWSVADWRYRPGPRHCLRLRLSHVSSIFPSLLSMAVNGCCLVYPVPPVKGPACTSLHCDADRYFSFRLHVDRPAFLRPS